ncbi:MAG: DUF6311 domain-containing protein [Proteobacteria bacterium]|nr:DUF6311 domain-containing protein [Cystobacterineae bacterium]MCL2258503.1 DUF6311 domain-containing protein [Cystobacterineae bacterium]MCL2315157.1 DUF6311 domain-containing protein [Pseudomonadota bacterium]
MFLKHKKTLLNYITPCLLGAASFFCVLGPRILNPTNIRWLGEGDPLACYLGWLFFRYSPWAFPAGSNPDYGLENALSLVHSGATSLLALLFKPFSAILPEPFQYDGIWLLVCFVLQAVFAWKLMSLITDGFWARFAGIFLFIFSPPMLQRLNGHYSLVSHFLILAALYMALRSLRHTEMNFWPRTIIWSLLLACSVMIHPYFVGLVGAIWASDWSWRWYKSRKNHREPLAEFTFLVCALTFTCWQCGYFSPVQSIDEGFGFYRMNLLSLFDSNGSYSFFMKDIPSAPGETEGFNFLGLGAICLLLFALPILIGRTEYAVSLIKRRPFLFAAMVALFLFSLSKNISLGPYSVSIKLSPFMNNVASVFRASGRIFWPVWYCLLILFIYAIFRASRYRTACLLLAISAIIQVTDTSGQWYAFRKRYMQEPGTSFKSGLQSPFWLAAAAHYRNLRFLYNEPLEYRNWMMFHKFDAYTGNHRLAINFPYGRPPTLQRDETNRKHYLKMIESGTYSDDTLYIMKPEFSHLVMKTYNYHDDFVGLVDEVLVLAPKWRKICGDSACTIPGDHPAPALKKQMKNDILNNEDGYQYFPWGWYFPPQSKTAAAIGYKAKVVLPLGEPIHAIRLDIEGITSPSHPQQRVLVSINGMSTGEVTVRDRKTVVFPVPEQVYTELEKESGGFLSVDFDLPDAASPKKMGINEDKRILSIYVHSIALE